MEYTYIFGELNCSRYIRDSLKFLFLYKTILYFALLMTKTWRRKISTVYWLERREIVRNCATQNALYVPEIYFPFSSGKSKVHYQQIMGREKFYCNRYYLALADELLPPLNRYYRIFHGFHGLVTYTREN